MKKSTYWIVLAVALAWTVYTSFACTNVLVSKGASKDGSAMIAYNADAGGFMEPLFYLPAADHKSGEMLDVYEWDTGKFLGKIPQVAHTYQVLGNINENQVSIGETTFTGREALQDTTGIVDYGSLMCIALQRSKTAREALKVMTDLVEKYGYYSTGESFSIGDPNEVWILEMIGKGPGNRGAVWVARRVPDGYICAHANQSRIREFPLKDPDNCIYAKDVIDFAVKQGYYKKSDGAFKFADAYCPIDPSGLLFCEGRVWSIFNRAAVSLHLSPDYWRAVEGAESYPLFIKPDNKLSVRDVIALMRDHFDSTEWDMTKGLVAEPFGSPIRWKPLTWKVEGDTATEYGWERPISSQQTAFTFVSQLRAFLPNEIGGVFWYGVDDSYSNVYFPLYCSITRAPKAYQIGSISDFSTESGFWMFNLVANLAYTKYCYVIKDIQVVQKRLEDKYFALQPAVEMAAAELYKTNKAAAVEYLTDYSNMQADNTLKEWTNLWKQLVMKYNDGYINDVSKDKGRSPSGKGYGNNFYKRVIQERPDYYKVKWIKK